MMNDLHNKTIDVLKAYLLMQDQSHFPKKPYSVSTVIQNYYNFDDHRGYTLEIEKSIVQELKLGDMYSDDRLIQIDWHKLREFIAPYDLIEYLIDRCFDFMLTKGRGGDAGSLLKVQQVELDRLIGKNIEAKINNSGLVNATRAKAGEFEYIFILNSTGIEVLSDFEKYSDYKYFIDNNKPKPVQPVINQTFIGRDMVNSTIAQDLKDSSLEHKSEIPDENSKTPIKNKKITWESILKITAAVLTLTYAVLKALSII